jgi:hypothetical protein
LLLSNAIPNQTGVRIVSDIVLKKNPKGTFCIKPCFGIPTRYNSRFILAATIQPGKNVIACGLAAE